MATKAKPLSLVPIGEKYLDFWCRLRNAPENLQHQPIVETSRDQLSLMLGRYRDSDLSNTAQPAYKWMVLAPGDEPVGVVSFNRVQIEQGIGRIGYSILPDFWDRGYGTAAVRALVELLFTQAGVERLEAVCSIHNHASRRVLEKVGFKMEGIKRGYLRIRGCRIDHFSFGLLKTDWLAQG